MSLRLKSAAELPPHLRRHVEARLGVSAKQRVAKTATCELAKAQRKARAAANRGKLTGVFEQQLEQANLRSLFVTEYRFDPARKWRFDFYSAAWQLAIEIHGATRSGGRHTRGKGFEADREKMNAAQEAGITVLEYPRLALHDGSAIAQVRRIIAARAA